MGIDFSKTSRSQLGIEWELACVDRTTRELVPAAPELLAILGDFDGFPCVTRELLTNTVELVGSPSRRVADAVLEIRNLLDEVHRVADPRGVDLMSAGTHPFSSALDQQVTPDNPRYATLIDRTRWWGRQMMIWGVHVHVSVDDRRKVLPIIDGLISHLPQLQALSASSPFWNGTDTGYASNRTMLFQQLPTAGLPPQFREWEQYESMVSDLTHAGVIAHHSELRWDIRPSPKWGTIEVRAFDGVSTLHEIGALAALAQCLVEHYSRELDAGREIPSLQPWFVRENKWRAARYGMDANIIANPGGDERPVTQALDDLLITLEPVSEHLGCSSELRAVRDVIERGASYQRQLRVADSNPGDLRAVVTHLIGELQEDPWA